MKLDTRQTAHILAALRHCQNAHNVVLDTGHPSLTDEEMDALHTAMSGDVRIIETRTHNEEEEEKG